MSDLIWVKPNIQGGIPCIAGTRIPVVAIQSWAQEGFSNERIRDEFPGLTDEQIDAAKAYNAAPVSPETPPMTDLDKLEALAKGAIEGWSGSRVIGRSDAATILDLIASARRDAEEIERLIGLLKPFAVYYKINDLDERLADDAIEVPVGDLRAVHRALTARASHTGEG